MKKKIYKGVIYPSGENVLMVNNGIMSDGRLTYQKANTISHLMFGIDDDGYIRQYIKDRHNVFYLLTEDKYNY